MVSIAIIIKIKQGINTDSRYLSPFYQPPKNINFFFVIMIIIATFALEKIKGA